MPILNPHQLEVFRVVARCRNLTRAAAVLGISQPGISAHIKELERASGLQLLERHARGVRLTHAGEVVLGYAQRLNATLDELARALDDLRGLQRGRLIL